jgi:hypothetical protein
MSWLAPSGAIGWLGNRHRPGQAGTRRLAARQGPAVEYLIRRTDGEWFDLGPTRYDPAPRPSSMPSRRVEGWGDYRIEAGGVEVSFSCEDPGIQVTFEGEVPEAVADAVVREVLSNITAATGREGRVVKID